MTASSPQERLSGPSNMRANKLHYQLLGLEFGEDFKSMTVERLSSTCTVPTQQYMPPFAYGMEAAIKVAFAVRERQMGRGGLGHLWHFWPSALLTPTVMAPTPSISVQLL